MQTLAKPQNKISTKMQVFHHPQKLVPIKKNESTVCTSNIPEVFLLSFLKAAIS